MAKTIDEIYNSIGDAYASNKIIQKIYDLDATRSFADQFSATSLEAIIFYCVASAIWTLEQLFNLHKKEITEIINDQKVGSLRWYAYIARQFQYGDNLDPDTDKYNNEGKTAEEITESKIIAYSAVVKRVRVLLIKIAKLAGDGLTPLSDNELAAFSEYMNRVQCAGDELEFINLEADNLKLDLQIYYNPLVLDSTGKRLDGESQTPVIDAIREYLKVLPFNGELALAFLTDAMQAVDGVVIPHINEAQYQYGATAWLGIDVKYQPLSGYFAIADADIKIEYIPQTDLN